MKSEEIQKQIVDVLNQEHLERMKFLDEIKGRHIDDNIRREMREKLRYETAIDGIKKYFITVEEWDNENYKIGDCIILPKN